jgi:hypothetical protein
MAQDGQTLSASTGEWTGTPPLSYAYQWQRCNTSGESCSNISEAIGSTYALGHVDVGTTLRVTVTASNSAGPASSTSEATSVVAAVAPSNTAAPAISGEAKEGQTLTADAGSWEGTPSLSYSYQWESCNDLGEGCLDISGATASNYTVGLGEVGDALRVVVTATNSAGSTPSTSSASGVVAPASGAVPAGCAINGTPEACIASAQAAGFTDEEISVDEYGNFFWGASGARAYSTGTDDEFDVYENELEVEQGHVFRVNVAEGSISVFVGLDNGTLNEIVAPSDQANTCDYTNEACYGDATHYYGNPGVPTAPVNTSAPTISGAARSGITLRASTGTWTGSPTPSYTYQWESCDSLGEGCLGISGATTTSYKLGAGEVGETLRVVVSATNSAGSASSTSAATPVVVASSGSGGPLVYSAQFGSEGSGDGQFNHPGDVAIDSTGDLFVLDQDNGRVEVFNPEGEYLRQFGSTGTAAGKLRDPDGLAIDSKGDVWVADTGNSRVDEFNAQGEYLRTVGSGQVGVDEGVAVDTHDDVWVSDTSAGDLVVFNGEGEYLKTVGSRGSGAGQIGEPEGLAVNSYGDVWVADWSNDRVEEFDEEGDFVQQFGVAGAGESQLRQPYGIAAGPAGEVFVGEVGNDRVQQFNESGEPVSQLGSSGSAPGELSLSYPMGLAVSNEDVWVADSNNDRVEEWAPEALAAPSNTSPPSISGEPFEGQTISASTGRWRGTSPLSYSYQWQSCNSSGGECADITGATSDGYTPAGADVGATIRVLVTATNSLGSAVASSQSTAVISTPAPPLSTSPPAISGAVQDGRTLSASAGAWTAAPSPTYSYQWQSCNSAGENCSNVSGATSSTYVLGHGDVGTTLRVTVEATNFAGSAASTSEATEVVAAAAPANTMAPAVSGEATEGQALAADTGSWTGTPPLTYAYQWQSCDVSGEECADIEGAVESEYVLGAGDVGTTLRVIVTAENSAGSASSASEATAVVVGTPPSDSAPPSISGTAQDGQRLSANTGTWEGAQPVSYAYQWQRCDGLGEGCFDVARATGSSYMVGPSDVGGTIDVVVTATNAAGSTASTSELTAVVTALAPSNTIPPGLSGQPVAGRALASSTGSWTGSAPLSYSYKWQSCNAAGGECTNIEGATTATYTLGDGDIGRSVRSLVTASNSGGSATEASSPSSVVSSAIAPSNTTVPTISGTARDGQTLLADAGSWEGTPPTYSYQWQSCNPQGAECENIEGETEATYTLAFGDVGTSVRVLVTATNDAGTAQATSATTAQVESGSPSELEAPSITGVADAGEALSAHPGEWGGAEVEIGYQWESCNPEGTECQDIVGATESGYQLGRGDIGTTLRVRIMASNEQASLTALSVPTAVIGSEASTLSANFPPSLSGATQSGQTLTVDAGSWTGEGPVTYAYAWQRCDVNGSDCEAIAGTEAESLSLVSEDVGSTVRAIVTATDANGSLTQTTPVTQPVATEGSPVIEEAPAVYGTTLEGQTIDATPGTWTVGATPLTYTYQWERCDEDGGMCQTVVGATGNTRLISGADVGSTLRVLATAHSAEGEATAVSTATAAIAPASLTAVSASSISGAAEIGHPLSANAGIWTALGPIAYSYQWERCDASGEGCTEISGETASSYTPGVGDLGDSIRAAIEATDGEEKRTSRSAATAAVISADTPPENTLTPSIEGAFTAGETLSATIGAWAGAEPIAYTYQWQSCSAVDQECADIEGATEATYILGEGDVGTSIRLLVTATNSLASTTAASGGSELVGAPGPPAAIEGPTIYGTAKEGAKVFVANGNWSGTRPLHYLYQWERCNEAGEACANIEAATKPSYQLQSTDVGSTLRVRVTVTNSAGEASSVSTQVAVTVDGQPSAAQAIETAEQVDPSLLAPSSGASLDEQQIKPALTDSGEELSSESVLNSSTISKQTTGEFAVNTTAGDLSFEPAENGPGAATLPTIVNGAAAVFADSSTATDTILRPEPLGATDILELRSPQAPTSFSWQVHIGPTQQLEQLPDGGVAVVEAPSEGEGESEGGEPNLSTRFTPSLSPGRPAAPRFASPLGTGEGEGVDGQAAEREYEESLTGEGPSSTLPPAPTASTAEAPPAEAGELDPASTQAEYETATSELEAAEGHVTGNVLMVIAPPTVADAERHSVPASLSVRGETVTLTLSPPENAAYPLSAETAVAGSSEQPEALSQLRAFDFDADTARSGARLYGLSASYKSPQDFAESEEHEKPVPTFDKRLTDGTGKMRVSIARVIVPYNLKESEPGWAELEHWLAVIGKTPGLKPFITFADPVQHYYCGSAKECQEDRPKTGEEYGNEIERIIKAFMNAKGLPPVNYWGAWNEPDLNHGTKKYLYYDDAPGAALIWRYAEGALKASGCAGCYMLAGEFSEYKSSYVAEYKKTIIGQQSAPVTIEKAVVKPGKPIIWGLHDYHDLVYFSEHHENTDARGFVSALNSLNPRIWLSELGVELEDGGGLTTLQTGKRGGRSVKHLVHGKSKVENPNELQTEAANDFLTLGTLPHVEMLDYYQYRAHSEFDSALLNPTGKEPHDWREAYCVLALGKSRGCPAWVKPHSTILPKPKTPTTAKVASIVDPRGLPTEYWLEYGETTAYGQQTPRTELPNETGEQSITSALSGLKPCTTYHYQVEAENEGNEGMPSLGGDEEFTTPCGRAVVEDPKCTANVLPANDDNSTGLISLPFMINFYGRHFSGLYVNNNGNVTFNEALRQWTPYRFSEASRPIMAPFLADVDTRGGKREEGGGGGGGGTADVVRSSVTGSPSRNEGESGVSGLTSYGDTTFEGRPAFCVDWPYVGYYYKHTDKLNDFQLMLVNRSDIAPGDFEMIFNYDQVQWETGDFNGGSDGLGGTSAAVGFSNGAGETFEFPGSRKPGELLDSNTSTGLIYGDRGSAVPGRYIFDVFAGG